MLREDERHHLKLVATCVATAMFIAALLGCEQQEQPSGDEPVIGGDFTLDSASGPVSLHDFRGKAVLAYFGYTHCPDVCPTTLANVAATLDMLDEAERARVQSLFISVDPGRDTVKIVTDYARYFHPAMIGLSGEKKAVKAAAAKYQVFFSKFFDQDSEADDDYKMTHADHLFLIDDQGSVVDMMSHNTKPEDIVAAVRRQLR
ncbi:MAG: SCO family protein [Mariprofundaceae bacterium]